MWKTAGVRPGKGMLDIRNSFGFRTKRSKDDANYDSWHSLDLRDVLKQLGSNETTGLSSAEVQKRLARVGPNVLREEGWLKVPQLIRSQFGNAFIVMLVIAGTLFWVVEIPTQGEGDFPGAILIGAIVLLAVTTGFVYEYRLGQAIRAIPRAAGPTARVLRDGCELTIPASEIVPGDVILVNKGDLVPADALLLEATSLKTNEAPLTGESVQVDKMVGLVNEKTAVIDRNNSVFMGTHVVQGCGKAIVTCTGMNTEFGRAICRAGRRAAKEQRGA